MKNDETNDPYDDEEEQEEGQSESRASDIANEIKDRAKQEMQEKMKEEKESSKADSGKQEGKSNSPEQSQSGTNTSQGVNGQGGSANGASSASGGTSAGATTGGTSAGASTGAAEAGAASGASTGAASGAAASGTAASGAAAGGAAAGGATAGAAATAATPIGWIILIILAVVLLIMMIVGIVVFVVDGVGLIQEKILSIADGIWTNVVSLFTGRDEAQVKKETISEVANYLEEMGYNLENFGFLDSNGKSVTENEKEDGSEELKNNKGEVILKRDSEGKITEVSSDCLWAYLVAENRMYLDENDISNYQVNIGEMFLHTIFPWLYITDAIGGGTSVVNGVGMLSIDDTLFDGYSVDIDRENKQMRVTKDGDIYVYNLDGWTGRYGKPLEFSLTLHLATMAPDFAKEVALSEDFDTKVEIGMWPIDASITLMVGNENRRTTPNTINIQYLKR